MITRTVTHSEQGKKLHRYIRTLFPQQPLGLLYRLIDQGDIRVNGKRKKQNYVLQPNDVVWIPLEGATSPVLSHKYHGIDRKIDVVYEDDHLLIVNKPVGVLTHPDQKTPRSGSLIDRVHAYLHDRGQLAPTLFMPAPVNRLDRNTSGIVLIGKTAVQTQQLNQWFQTRSIHKTYWTIVHGTLLGAGDICHSLRRDARGERTLIATEEEAQPAWTAYRTLSTHQDVSLVEVTLHSGRTHQIRAHFESIGHSLVGDTKYGGLPWMQPYVLHAGYVRLPDGRNWSAPLPRAFVDAVERWHLQMPPWPLAPTASTD